LYDWRSGEECGYYMSSTPRQFRVFNLPHGASLCSWRARETNLAWLLVDQDSRAVCVDVPDAESLLRVLEIRGLRLTDLLFTHSHADHIDRVSWVLEQTGCRAWGSAKGNLPVPVTSLSDGDRLKLGGWSLHVLETSGHTAVDLSFHLPELSLCFCGDTVFDGGCGRMFSGPASLFWASIQKLNTLPAATCLCMGHTYAQESYQFARSVLPEDSNLEAREKEALQCSPFFRFPVTVEDQQRDNLFFRADDPKVGMALAMSGSSPEEVFQELRERKNRF